MVSGGMDGRVREALAAGTEAVTDDDVARALDNREPIMGKVLGSRHLAGFLNDIELLFCMIRDHCAKRYREVPWNTIAGVTATLLYILNPFDVIPDFIPGVGYIDDGMVVMLAMKLAGRDIERYRRWRNQSSGNS